MITITIDGRQHIAPSVEELRGAGLKVFIHHDRYVTETFVGISPTLYRRGWHVEPKGGATHIRILAPEGHWSEGVAYCTKQDVFVKSAGYVLAVNRALAALEYARGDKHGARRVQVYAR